MQENWTIKDLVEWTTRFFSDKGIEEPRLNAEVLLAHVLEKDRVYLYANYHAPVNRNERDRYRELIKRRAGMEPLAYLTGTREFMSLEFQVSPAVLIPRPETELLVEKVLELARPLEAVSICDVGTGSGAIAVSLAYYLPGAAVYAVDISDAALQVAKQNAQRYGVAVEFSQGDLLSRVHQAEPFDIICANLPYISDEEYAELEPGVREYEPQQALLGVGDGLELYRRLVPQAWPLLKPGGFMLWEIGWQQGQVAAGLLPVTAQVQVFQDWSGKDRLIVAEKEAHG